MKTTTDTYHRVEDLPAEVAGAVLRWTLSLADTKHKLGIRVSEWVNGGPALEAAVGASAITQDELGHARSLFAFLKAFPDAPEGIGAENDLQARKLYYSPRQLDHSWDSWLDLIAANVLLDSALNFAVAAFSESSFSPLRSRCAKILQEERFHRIFGDSWLARMAAWDENKKAQMQDALDRHWPIALGWLVPDEDPVSDLLVREGILNLTPVQMRESWLGRVRPLLAENGLEPGPASAAWSGWHPQHRHLESAL